MAPDQIAISLSGVARQGSLTLFRYSTYDVPFWVRPNTRPGRWHRVGDPPTQYWSMSSDAAWAELIRAESLRTEEELELLRMPLWVARAPTAKLVDLSDVDACRRHQVREAILTADDWGACQDLGRRLRDDGFSGVITPSVSLDGHRNVTLFGARRQISWIDRPALARTVPAAIAAIGRPRRGLIAAVRRPPDPSGRQSLF